MSKRVKMLERNVLGVLGWVQERLTEQNAELTRLTVISLFNPELVEEVSVVVEVIEE